MENIDETDESEYETIARQANELFCLFGPAANAVEIRNEKITGEFVVIFDYQDEKQIFNRVHEIMKEENDQIEHMKVIFDKNYKEYFISEYNDIKFIQYEKAKPKLEVLKQQATELLELLAPAAKDIEVVYIEQDRQYITTVYYTKRSEIVEACKKLKRKGFKVRQSKVNTFVNEYKDLDIINYTKGTISTEIENAEPCCECSKRIDDLAEVKYQEWKECWARDLEEKIKNKNKYIAELTKGINDVGWEVYNKKDGSFNFLRRIKV